MELKQTLAEVLFGRKPDGTCCVQCGTIRIQPGDFRDEISRREWEISRFCQQCQDRIFGKPEDDDDED